jgi:hypothetical protein
VRDQSIGHAHYEQDSPESIDSPAGQIVSNFSDRFMLDCGRRTYPYLESSR